MDDKHRGGSGYRGVERRRVQRRTRAEDRRQGIRWEPDKEPRRGNQDRRLSAKIWDKLPRR
jgi:hypothetical protein